MKGRCRCVWLNDHMKQLRNLLAVALFATVGVVASPTPAAAATYYFGTTAYWNSLDTKAYCYRPAQRLSNGTRVCGHPQSGSTNGYVNIAYPGQAAQCYRRLFSYGYVTPNHGSYFRWTSGLYYRHGAWGC